MQRLTWKDYLAWIGTVLGLFVLFLWVGDFGKLGYLVQSPISDYISNLWLITYIAGGGVFSVFMGSLIFFAVKFKERGEEVTIKVPRAKEDLFFFKISFPFLITSSALLGYDISLYLSNPVTTMNYQFVIGLLITFEVAVLGAIIFVIYKAFYSD